jgi:magnesium chelatase family protein
MSVVGLADKAVAEGRERVRAALHAIGLALPNKRITVNLSPADLPKEGSHYDLPIALGLLTAMSVLPAPEMANHMALGELPLDGALIPVAGILPAAIKALELNARSSAQDSGPEAAGPAPQSSLRRRRRADQSSEGRC